MWVVQLQKDLANLSKHYIHEIDALVSSAKKTTQKQKPSSSEIVSLPSQGSRGIQMYKINFVCRAIYVRDGPYAGAVNLFVFTRCGPACARTLTLRLTYS